MSGLTLLVLFFVAALVGWGVCEAVGQMRFDHAPEEQEGWDEFAEHARMNGGKEQNIRDIMHNNSTQGYSAV